jgi:hypothetical protein
VRHHRYNLAASFLHRSWVPMLFIEIGLFLFFTAMCLGLGTFVPMKRIMGMDKPVRVWCMCCCLHYWCFYCAMLLLHACAPHGEHAPEGMGWCAGRIHAPCGGRCAWPPSGARAPARPASEPFGDACLAEHAPHDTRVYDTHTLRTTHV